MLGGGILTSLKENLKAAMAWTCLLAAIPFAIKGIMELAIAVTLIGVFGELYVGPGSFSRLGHKILNWLKSWNNYQAGE